MLGLQGILIALLACLLILHFLKQLSPRRTYPPGPLRLPIIGSVWRLGFKLSKDLLSMDTVVLPDLRSVLLDPKQWETPEAFNPNHFLDKDGSFLEREAFLPFGAGGRECLGQQIVKNELFIFFINLLRSFTFQLPEGVKQLSEEPILGTSLSPQPYKICAVPRCSTS